MKLDLNQLSLKNYEDENLTERSEKKIFSIEDLAGYIKEIRKKKNLSQTDLATYANVSRLAISELENGKSDIKLSTLLKILTACSLDMVVKER